MEKKKNVPEIRFKGFTDEWEQCELLSIINDIGDGPFGSNLKTEHYTVKKEARIIQLSNITDSGWNESNTRYTTYEYAKTLRRSIVQENEVVIAKMMPAGMSIIRPNTDKMYVLSSDCVRVKFDNQKIKNDYFLFYSKSTPYLEQISNDSQGSTRNRTSISKIRNLKIVKPKISEQETIGDFFNSLNNLITLHQRKCEKLKELKKSMLEKMFPKNGEKTPEVRFKGFTDEWEQRKLKELGNIITGSTPSTNVKEYYSETGMPWVTPTDINTTVIYDTEKKLSAEGSKVGRVVPKNSVLISCIASIGKNTMLGTSGSFNQQINALVPIEDENFPYFLLTLSNIWSEDMKKSAATATMQIVNKNEFSNLYTKVPSLDEQTKIGELFIKVDNLITLHQRKVEKLQQIKKSMLEKMFV